MSTKPPSKSVFVGNIPYGLTEEQIIDIFSSAGKVVNFRLVYDRETGRPKGFGFAEYPDSDSAASAVRNLNDYEIMNRKLRVDFSNDGAEDETSAPTGYQHPPLPLNGVPVPPPGMAPPNGSSTLPPLPQGIDLPPGLTCPDSISRTLNTLPPSQLLDVLSQMKSLVTTDQGKAIELLRQAPQLSYAIFQALLLMGLVSTDSLASVVDAAGAPPQGAAAAPTQAPAPHYPSAPSGYPAPGQMGTPPTHGMPYPPPPQQSYQQQPPPAAAGQPDADALIQQVLTMPQELIDQLAPAERNQLLALRAQFMPRPKMGSRLEKNSKATHKRIAEHTFDTEEGEEYKGSDFGGFSEYFRRKKIKLQNLDADLRAQSPDKPPIFRGIVAHVNGYTQPSLNDLHKLIVTHGGGFVQYLDGKTTATHIIAANLTPKKAIEFRNYRIVKPAWIVDSVANGKVLPWQSYKVLDGGVTQKTLGFEQGRVVNRVESRTKGYMDQTKTSWYNSQVKNIADEIDDEEEVLDVQSTERISDGRAQTYTHSQSFHRRSQHPTPAKPNDNEGADGPDNELKLSNTDSFDLTSSLEDALNAADYNILASRSAQIKSTDQSPPGNAVEQIYDETTEPRESASAVSSPRGRKGSHSIESTLTSKGEKPVTAEEHNAMLLADPKIRQSSTANPDFLKQFYSESRLHHLSTWKAELKSKFQQMASEQSLSQKNRLKRKPGSRQYVMHVDFDSFFCAVSLLSAPEYIDKPAVVAHGSGSGSEIASCNYPARDFGVKNGMWMKQAQKLCPDIKVLPYDFPAYEDASKKFYQAILSIGGVVQSVSIDEALIDISSLCISVNESGGIGGSEEHIRQEQKKADEIGQTVRRKIKDATNCAVSVGIGSNILLAKVALRKAKPAGQYQIKPEEVLDFIGELAVQNLPGVAYSIGGKLEEIGIKFVKDVRNSTKDRLMTVLGPKTGEKIWEYSRGIDHTEVGELITRKSVSAEVNWGIRFINQQEAEEFVKNLCGELHKRLMNEAVKGRQLTVKIMRKSADSPLDPAKHLGHGKCDVFNKSVSLGVASNAIEILAKEAISVLRAFGFSPGELRGLGVQMTKLEPIKRSVDGRPDGSQKTLSFPKPSVPRPPRQEISEPIDDPETPRKSKPTPNRSHAEIEDIDPDSPLKPRGAPIHPAAAITRANAADPSAVKPLNLTGTQFILPTQVDPAVLAELPLDIRSRLLAKSKGNTPSRASPWSNSPRPVLESRSKTPTPEPNSRSASLDPPAAPLPSQLDPEVFESLPEDVKAEVLASYGAIRGNLPQQRIASLSPRKIGTSNLAKKPTTPTKKPTSLLLKSRHSKSTSNSTLIQSNFFTGRKGESSTRPGDIANDSDAIDPDFLAAIPEDMRDEIIAEHKRARLVARSGLVAPTKSKKRPPELPQGQRKLQLPPRPPKPTFTTADISVLPDLRQTISRWYTEFRNEGPHEDDVKAMERYLRRVVLDEKDMAKAVSVVKWMVWLIYDSGGDGFQTDIGEKGWREALNGIKEHIQQAVSERGVGSIDFDF
ncbi:hypothetical protein V496_03502 [Pseudogymnoascus sp. VKM F-4515 (FW-2607)]|nr:hypothetical protein V496_03502 [Pseudogymnoascus sp. VKM F-4515 (FW-2607)]